ncbi:DsrE family protein [Pseudoalteromonas luteoviolacea]|uniref:DsrE family protein n=1 Tax=Pseudoalteromonas luteoviolacea TaxID=43657 RepID=UPI001F3590B1|nr:DsrE family protein [Pseudoalteromonas luteoviolacea]MCF6440681.1 DsrE family protein [Pseudoalteromonas luteoviolacea]
MTKKVLVICDASPFDKQIIRDSLDMALIFAAIDQEVSWLFRGPSVLALKEGQKPNQLGIKDFLKQLKTLEIYDVDSIFVCENALSDLSISKEQLAIDADALNINQQQALLSEQDHVVKL